MVQAKNGKHERIVRYVWAYLSVHEPGELSCHYEYNKRNGDTAGELDILRQVKEPRETHYYEIKCTNHRNRRKSATEQIYRYADHIKAYESSNIYVGWYCRRTGTGIITLEPILQIRTTGLEAIILETGDRTL